MRHVITLICMLAVVSVSAGPLEESGVKGGLAVVIGGDDTELIRNLGKNEKFLVQVLDTDSAKIEKLRDTIRNNGNYGRVSAVVFDGKTLPYAENLVNLIVVKDAKSELGNEEIKRVLAPRGVALGSALGKSFIKPVPSDIDEWTHFLYDSKNNAVSHDKQVHTPKRLQWDSGPKWSRHHDHMSSISGVVSANGRLFSIIDEGPRSSIQLPADWQVVARDAFNGKLLWKRAIGEWHSRLWPAKAGPAQLPRRIVAVGDKVYVTLGLHAPVTMLDAATGKTLTTFDATEHTEELLVSGNQLIVSAHASEPPKGEWRLDTVRCWVESSRANRSRPWQWESEDPKRIIVVDIPTGKVLWSNDTTLAPLTLGADTNHVVYFNGEMVVCLARSSGKELWSTEQESPTVFAVRAAPNLVIYGDVVLFSAGPGTVNSMSLKDGSELWSAPHGSSGHQSSYDLLVADGLVWSTSVRGKGLPWTFTGRDPVTGEEKKVFPPGQSDWFHHRCHRGRATDNYLIMARTGIEYIDLKTGKWQPNPWVRGACLYGYMPANGLTYAPPHPCACYIESKLTGFNALTGEAPKSSKQNTNRLETGPAYGKVEAKATGKEDWPTYRSDNKRSGSSSTKIPAKLKETWRADLGGKLSPVTIADGKLFVAAVDRHMVYALDANTGKVLWSFTADGRVDTPPTIYGTMAIFGCRDGWVYCVRTTDGELVWRYRAAPEERRIVSYEQLESVWPVNGAVLVQNGSVYGVAGRSMFLDGGLHIFKLNALTGAKEFDEIMDDKIPGSGEPLDTTAAGLDMAVALPDILSSDGKRLYMRSQVIGMDGKRPNIDTTRATDQGGEEAHLICSSGFLDDSWFHRAYWVFGRGYGTGHNGWFRAGRFAPAGRMLVFNDDNVYGYGRLPNLYVWSSVLEYQLYSAKKEVSPEAIRRVSTANQQQESNARKAKKAKKVPKDQEVQKGGHGHGITFDRSLYGTYPLKEISAIAFNWRNTNQPLQARAMALAGDNLIIAGPPDVLDEEEIFAKPFDRKVVSQAKGQVAALEGKKGALLQVISTGDGRKLNEIKLSSNPVFNGVAVARGKLYISTSDGKVICLGR